jgi:hypothetical protein
MVGFSGARALAESRRRDGARFASSIRVNPPDDDVWLVQMRSGELRSMTPEQLDRAYHTDIIDERTLVLSYDGFHWVTLAELAGPDVDAPVAAMAADTAAPAHPSADRHVKKSVVVWTLVFAVMGGSLGAAAGAATSRSSSVSSSAGHGLVALGVAERSAPPTVADTAPAANADDAETGIHKPRMKGRHRRATPRRSKHRL